MDEHILALRRSYEEQLRMMEKARVETAQEIAQLANAHWYQHKQTLFSAFRDLMEEHVPEENLKEFEADVERLWATNEGFSINLTVERKEKAQINSIIN